jgi:hypothetical protein
MEREGNEKDVNPNLEVIIVGKMNRGSPHFPPFTSIKGEFPLISFIGEHLKAIISFHLSCIIHLSVTSDDVRPIINQAYGL